MDVINKVSGPCVILAGAGTGKTYAIVEKVKHLIEGRVYEPEKIVCITFSNEAADSLFSRIKKKISIDKEPIIKTFHSFSAELLREHGEKIGVKNDFKILTPDEAKIVLHKFFGVSSFNCHRYVETIGKAKDLGIGIEKLEKYFNKKINADEDIDKKFHEMHLELQKMNEERDKEKKQEFTKKLKEFNDLRELKKFIASWKAYEKVKIKQGYQDYSDLNNNALELLKKYPEIADEFQYFVVDEFQDTNKIQLELIKYLCPHKNITIVGDLNQSIYAFRGAYRENLEKFKVYFDVKEGDIFNLDKSYRSPNKVLAAAHNLIANNYENKQDCFEVRNIEDRQGENIEVYEMKNAKEEARKIVELIEQEKNKNMPLNEICVMFRTHQQGRIIKNLLDYNNIPYYSVTRKSILKQNKIKIAVNYLRILDFICNNKKGGENVWWELVYQLGFEYEDLVEIGRFLIKNKENENLSKLAVNEIYNLPLSSRGKVLVKKIGGQIEGLLPHANKKVHELLQEVYSVAGLEDENDKQNTIDLNKLYDVALNNVALHYGELGNFVHYIEILENLGIDIISSEIENNGIRLMTSHATKGLEYDVVIITNLAQKRFPIERIRRNNLLPFEVYNKIEDEKELEEFQRVNQLLEERRLCYVSFTRAKKKLILTYSKEYASKKAYVSQFLNEINYKNNPDVAFSVDDGEKYVEPEIKIADTFNLNNVMKKNIAVESTKERKMPSLSPSSLLAFKECQKKFEYKYVYNMPEKKPVAWEEIRLGSFIHQVLDQGVKRNLSSEREFIDLVKELHRKEDWQSVDLDGAAHLVRIFFERNKTKYDKDSRTECRLNMTLNGMRFTGFADRIDFTPKGLEIIDYKTGKSQVPALNRNWQLGYYALAAAQIGKVHKITLDMLKHDKPMEFELDNDGIARSVNGRVEFNLNEVKKEIIDTAEEIKNAYEKGFKPCPIEKNCEFCNEYVYGG